MRVRDLDPAFSIAREGAVGCGERDPGRSHLLGGAGEGLAVLGDAVAAATIYGLSNHNHGRGAMR